MNYDTSGLGGRGSRLREDPPKGLTDAPLTKQMVITDASIASTGKVSSDMGSPMIFPRRNAG